MVLLYSRMKKRSHNHSRVQRNRPVVTLNRFSSRPSHACIPRAKERVARLGGCPHVGYLVHVADCNSVQKPAGIAWCFPFPFAAFTPGVASRKLMAVHKVHNRAGKFDHRSVVHSAESDTACSRGGIEGKPALFEANYSPETFAWIHSSSSISPSDHRLHLPIANTNSKASGPDRTEVESNPETSIWRKVQWSLRNSGMFCRYYLVLLYSPDHRRLCLDFRVQMSNGLLNPGLRRKLLR